MTVDPDPSTLRAEVQQALATWPFIPAVEREHGLPANLLLAVGSRETNLRNIVGDNGHGHGVWQIDDRSHKLANPAEFDGNVQEQAEFAAGLLEGLHRQFGDWRVALNEYNSGQPNDFPTTGHDYGPDVLHRLSIINGGS